MIVLVFHSLFYSLLNLLCFAVTPGACACSHHGDAKPPHTLFRYVPIVATTPGQNKKKATCLSTFFHPSTSSCCQTAFPTETSTSLRQNQALYSCASRLWMDLVSDPSRSYRAPLLPLLTPGFSARQRDHPLPCPPTSNHRALVDFGWGSGIDEWRSCTTPSVQGPPMGDVSRYLDGRWWVNLVTRGVGLVRVRHGSSSSPAAVWSMIAECYLVKARFIPPRGHSFSQSASTIRQKVQALPLPSPGRVRSF
ncbi:hypothetical protein GGI42DRAFT_5599 [Trichoderma sp. SZMC 28013]